MPRCVVHHEINVTTSQGKCPICAEYERLPVAPLPAYLQARIAAVTTSAQKSISAERPPRKPDRVRAARQPHVTRSSKPRNPFAGGRQVSLIPGSFGASLRAARRAKGYSQRTLSQTLGVDLSTVSNWERGISRPDPVMLHRLTRVLETTLPTEGWGELTPRQRAYRFPAHERIRRYGLRRTGRKAPSIAKIARVLVLPDAPESDER